MHVRDRNKHDVSEHRKTDDWTGLLRYANAFRTFYKKYDFSK